MEIDPIDMFHGQEIQHGKFNDRIYLMKFRSKQVDGLPEALLALAKERGYSKIFSKIPSQYAGRFESTGFECEACIPGFYNGKDDARMMCHFLSRERKHPATEATNEAVLIACRTKASQQNGPAVLLPEGLSLRPCGEQDAPSMAKLYATIFKSYPFPIDDPEYIRSTMESHVNYFGIWSGDRLLALSSAEMDVENLNAEMTDFATDPDARGQSLAVILLAEMEKAMKGKGFHTAYTIARAASFGMNITFAKRAYTFGGQLIKNTQIGGQFEDMNIWYKPL